MQKGIHPEYSPVVFYDRSADKYFLTKSTLAAKAASLPTIDWEDGNTYPLVNVERNGHEGQGIGPLIGPQGRLLCRPPARSPVRNQQEESPLEGEARLMALPKYRTSRANTHSRRSNWKAKVPQLATVRTPEGGVVQVPQNLAAAVRKGHMKP